MACKSRIYGRYRMSIMQNYSVSKFVSKAWVFISSRPNAIRISHVFWPTRGFVFWIWNSRYPFEMEDVATSMWNIASDLITLIRIFILLTKNFSSAKSLYRKVILLNMEWGEMQIWVPFYLALQEILKYGEVCVG